MDTRAQIRQERDARYKEMKKIADSMVGTEVYVTNTNTRTDLRNEGIFFTVEGTLETDGYGGYYINHIAVRMDFTANQIEAAWVAASGTIIRLNGEEL